jgi:hypothetical protein
MRETTLLKLALGCVLIGLPVLYLVSQHLNENAPSLKDSLTGTVIRAQSNDKFTKLTLTQDVNVVIFDKVSVPEGARIHATGTYNSNHTELIADMLRVG